MKRVTVTMLYSERSGRCRDALEGGWGFGVLDEMGEEIRALVAKTFSTSRIPLEDTDVSWIPARVDDAAHVPAVTIIIEAVGRKLLYDKLSPKVTDKFKVDLLAIGSLGKIPKDQLSMYIKFLNCLEL